MDLTDLTISQARAEILSGRLSCVDIAASALQAIERFDRESHAFITCRRPEDVLADARDLDSSTARDRPLLGIPVGVKDNFATAGLRTTAGSRILAKWVPRRDAHVVTKLRALLWSAS